MARQRKLSPERKAFVNSLQEYYQTTDANDAQEMLKDILVNVDWWQGKYPILTG